MSKIPGPRPPKPLNYPTYYELMKERDALKREVKELKTLLEKVKLSGDLGITGKYRPK